LLPVEYIAAHVGNGRKRKYQVKQTGEAELVWVTASKVQEHMIKTYESPAPTIDTVTLVDPNDGAPALAAAIPANANPIDKAALADAALAEAALATDELADADADGALAPIIGSFYRVALTCHMSASCAAAAAAASSSEKAGCGPLGGSSRKASTAASASLLDGE
jgi:hypothetical protein